MDQKQRERLDLCIEEIKATCPLIQTPAASEKRQQVIQSHFPDAVERKFVVDELKKKQFRLYSRMTESMGYETQGGAFVVTEAGVVKKIQREFDEVHEELTLFDLVLRLAPKEKTTPKTGGFMRLSKQNEEEEE